MVVPEFRPITKPEPVPTEATVVLLLVHTPPVVASLSMVDWPRHTEPDPVIDVRAALTVTTLVATQPVEVNVKLMVAVPVVRAETTPEVFTVATVELALPQVPLPVALLSGEVEPAHSVATPVIAEGSAITVTTLVITQPVVVNLYEIVAVPAATPVTTPVPEPTVAVLVFALIHVPELVASLNVVVAPIQTDAVPVMAAGSGLTVTVVVAGIADGHPLRNAVTV